MNSQERIYLNKFQPRQYQKPIFDAIENKGYKRVLAVLPRRAGKDICAWNLMIRQALQKIAVYYYIFPTYAQAKKVIWNSITNSGESFLDYIPPSLMSSKNSSEMKVVLINGSIIQLVGSDNVDSLVGTNPYGVVFSEFALQDPKAYQFLRPVLVANDGWMLFISTPRGKNHLWDILQIAKNNPAWFTYILSVEQTGHISLHDIEKERHEGLMSDDLIQQEYFCFPAGQQVLTTDGCVPIERIESGDMVISHCGRSRKVLATVSRRYKGQLIEISSYGSGEPIVCTPNHPIRIYHPNTQSYEWKEALFITESDRVVFPKMMLGGYPVISYELCMLLAWYITEGSCFNNAVQFTVKESESIEITHYLNMLKIPWKIHHRKIEKCVNVVINSVRLVDFFKSTCGLQANDKKIPFNLISTHEESFFHELIKGDGCFSKEGNYEKYCFTTVSKTLAYQIQILANSLNLGYAAGITKRDAYEGNIVGRIVQCQESYQVNIPIVSLRNTGFLIRAKNCVAAKVKYINSIDFEGNVYNIKVQYDESYLVGGRAVHNCSFELGVEGAFYSKYLDKMRISGQIGIVPHEAGYKTHTAWDLGMRDSTTIIWFQTIGQTVHIIDCYENSKQGLEHYIQVINNKNFIYGKHIAPHDIKVRELGTGMSRLEKAKQLGITFTVAPDVSIVDGIESVRSAFSKIWIDQNKCAPLIKALENYRQEYDQKHKVYKMNPLHNWSSHFSDCMRYLCISLPKTRDGLSPEELDKRYMDAMLGPNAGMPNIFRDDLPQY